MARRRGQALLKRLSLTQPLLSPKNRPRKARKGPQRSSRSEAKARVETQPPQPMASWVPRSQRRARYRHRKWPPSSIRRWRPLTRRLQWFRQRPQHLSRGLPRQGPLLRHQRRHEQSPRHRRPDELQLLHGFVVECSASAPQPPSSWAGLGSGSSSAPAPKLFRQVRSAHPSRRCRTCVPLMRRCHRKAHRTPPLAPQRPSSAPGQTPPHPQRRRIRPPLPRHCPPCL